MCNEPVPRYLRDIEVDDEFYLGEFCLVISQDGKIYSVSVVSRIDEVRDEKIEELLDFLLRVCNWKDDKAENKRDLGIEIQDDENQDTI